MIKKLIALLVGLVFALSLGTVAYGQEENFDPWQQNTQNTAAKKDASSKKNAKKASKKAGKKSGKQKAINAEDQQKEPQPKKVWWKFWE